MQKHHEPTDEIVLKATATILRWLQSDEGKQALIETEKVAPVSSSWHNTKIGFAIGRYAHHISDSTIAQADVNVLCKEVFGETVTEQAARKMAAKGGSVISEAKIASCRENAKKPRPRNK